MGGGGLGRITKGLRNRGEGGGGLGRITKELRNRGEGGGGYQNESRFVQMNILEVQIALKMKENDARGRQKV